MTGLFAKPDNETRFNVADPLPWGHVSIGASAGTGKTWTLAALATRYIAEADIAVNALLVVTFTRAAAAELRSRIRSRLTEAAGFCEQNLVGADVDASGDALLAHFAALPFDAQSLAAERLRRALRDFDSASIGTIHGFAQNVLGGLGSASHDGAAAELDENTFALIGEVASDLLVDFAAREDSNELHPPRFDELVSAANLIVNNPGIRVVPEPGDTDNPQALVRASMVADVVQEVERRRVLANTTGYTGLLTEVRDVLRNSSRSQLANELRQQFRVALVDEFQDTDSVQWEIFSLLFPSGCEAAEEPRALVVVGDPKQAIYAFRGANIYTYIDAIGSAEHSTLGMNFRSDGRLINALGVLFDGTVFGAGGIAFSGVESAQPASRIEVDGVTPPALVVRTVSADNAAAVNTHRGRVNAASGHELVAADLADRAVQLLQNGRIIIDSETKASRPVRAGDIAVLVTAYSQVPRLQAALHRRGVPAVVARTGNVFSSEAADHWKWLLHGLARPSDPQRARMVALSWFLPHDAGDIALFAEREMSALQSRLADWGDVLEREGVVALHHRIWAEGDLLARLLSFPDGERIITDLDHIAEVLASEVGGEATSALGLLAVFNELSLEDPDAAGRNDAVSRRLESDDNAVQIMTVHVSKGLEFPIVMCPTLWVPRKHQRASTTWQEDNYRFFDVANGLLWPDKAAATQRFDQSKTETVAEHLRLGYVALTRAAHQVIAWWVPGNDYGSTLGRLLFARTGLDVDVALLLDAKNFAPPKDLDETHAALAPLVDAADGALSVQEVDGSVLTARAVVPAPTPDERALALAPFSRQFDRHRRRWSFTSMTAGLYERHHHASAPLDDAERDSGPNDEPIEEQDLPGPTQDNPAALPLADVGAGAAFGTLVHHALEIVDFMDIDLRQALIVALHERHELAREMNDPEALADGLVASVQTPLGPLFNNRALAQVQRSDRLDEMTFDLPLGVGGKSASVAAIGELVARWGTGLPALDAWAQDLAAGTIRATLSGWLTGSIDAVICIRPDAANDDSPGQRPADRFMVVDYKSNLLAAPGKAPEIADYHPDRLVEAMIDHQYPLQALLYSAGLHRYLRWRLPDYNPDTHLGGVGYLFVRGMVGAATPHVAGVPHGVFSWRPAGGLVAELSDLLHSGESGE